MPLAITYRELSFGCGLSSEERTLHVPELSGQLTTQPLVSSYVFFPLD